jgi:hypothetical protein
MDEVIKSMKVAGMGLINNVLARVAVKLSPIIQRMTEWISANKDLINLRIDQIFKAIGKGAEIVVKLWKSGLIPAVIAAVAAFKAIQLAMVAFTAVQWLLNVAMTTNPIGLIIVGVGILIGLIVLLVMNWNKVVGALKIAWAATAKFFQNWGGLFQIILGPFGMIINLITTLATNWKGITAAFKEGGILEGLKAIGATILQALIRPLRDFLKLLSLIPGVGKVIKPAFDFVNGLDAGLGGAANKYKTPVSPQAAGLESRAYSESRSTVDLNVSAAPGASVAARQRGNAPGVSLNMGATSPLGAGATW